MLWGTKFVGRFKCTVSAAFVLTREELLCPLIHWDPVIHYHLLGVTFVWNTTSCLMWIVSVFFPARDNETRPAGQDLTDKELLKVVKTLGKEWEQVAIHLDLKTKDLDDIKAEERNVAMQKFKMLQLWQHRSPGKATVEDLLKGLEDMEELPVETHQLLKGNVLHLHTQGRLGAIGSLKAWDEKLCFVSKYIMS